MNGHDDIVAGAVIGRRALVEAANLKLGHLGGALDPHAAFLLHRGMKTLGVRVRQQNASALAIAALPRGPPRGRAACTIPGSKATRGTSARGACSTASAAC